MRKILIKIIRGTFLIAVALIAISNINLSQDKGGLTQIALNNIEALADGEPQGAGGECPNGGYYSTGKRSEDRESYWQAIGIKGGFKTDLGLFDSMDGAKSALANMGYTLSGEFTIKRVVTVGYDCDGSSTPKVCLVCNRYILA